MANMRYEQFAYFLFEVLHLWDTKSVFSYQRSENKEADEVGGQVPVGVAKSGSKKPLIKRTQSVMPFSTFIVRNLKEKKLRSFIMFIWIGNKYDFS